jgi:hypothetical protein
VTSNSAVTLTDFYRTVPMFRVRPPVRGSFNPRGGADRRGTVLLVDNHHVVDPRIVRVFHGNLIVNEHGVVEYE